MDTKILILAANPKDTSRLRLDEEVREIEDGLQRSKYRDHFTIQSKWAIRLRDLRRTMLDHKPQIVHFCGHGKGDAGLIIEEETGQSHSVSAEVLADFFKLFADTTQCVLLNACYSEVQAEAIAGHIDYVIGMNQAIGDKGALEFAIAFYDALGAGKSIPFAYEIGRNAIQMAGSQEHLAPVLIRRKGIDEETIEKKKPASTESQLGSIIYKMCNREDQEDDFLRFFKPKLKECPRQPQFYFIHGEDDECHESFIERLENDCIKKYVEREIGEHCADVYSKVIHWPTRGDLEIRKKYLIINFMKEFKESLEANSTNLTNMLSRLLSFYRHPVVIIKHNIDASQWDKQNEQLILWYIKCWANLECHDGIPQFLIFLNIIYSTTEWKQRIFRLKHSKKSIKRQLCRIHVSSGDPDPCQLIEELKAVTRIDVQEWFGVYNIYMDAWRRRDKVNEIFQENGQVVDRKNMADVEKHLKRIVEKYKKERSETAW